MRSGLHALGIEHQLSRTQHQALLALAEPADAPPRLAERLGPAAGLLAALLVGFGVVMWVAANWAEWGRPLHFALIQGLVLVSLAGVWLLPRARGGLGLLALLAQGGLFAYFGQTYQTGADPWQLFALWAVLALPLCWTVRHDAVWLPWTLVATLAVTLWVHTHSGHRWSAEGQTPHLLGTLVLLALGAALGPWWARHHGAGLWAWRAQGVWALGAIAGWALLALVSARWGAQYLLMGGLLLAVAALVWWVGDVVLASSAGLALNAWLLAGVARLMFEGSGDWLGRLFVFGLIAAGLLAATVTLLLRRFRVEGDAQ